MGIPYIIDRIEDGSWAVLEDTEGTLVEVPVGWLPTEAREGDRLMVAVEANDDQATLTVQRDEEATKERQQALQRRRDRLRGDTGSDITL